MTTATYKCMSVRQPYAWLIVIGEKTVENKGRSASHRGRLLIHSSSNRQDFLNFQANNPDVSLHTSWLSFGSIIGCVDLVDVVEMSQELEDNSWAFGPHCYLLEKPIWFAEPITCTGNVGLFNLPSSLVPRVNEQLANAPRKLSGVENTLNTIRGTDADLLWNRVDVAVDRGQMDDAKRFLDQLATKAADADVYRLRAEVHWELLKPREGLADCDEAIGRDVSNWDAHLLKGRFLEQMGFLDKAMECYEHVASRDNDNPQAHFGLGRIKVIRNDHASALQDFSRAIELDVNDYEKYLRRGFLHHMLGRHAEADRDYARAIVLVAEDPQASEVDEE
jgi:hypothetical protein